MAATIAYNQTTPTLISTLRHEIFKMQHQRFYKVIALVPPILTLIVMALMTVVLASGGNTSNYMPESYSETYDLGSQGAFALASTTAAIAFMLFSILIGFSCARIVEQEYRWNTLKTLVSRQTNRAVIVLAKAGAAAVFVTITTLSTIVSWAVFAFFLKAYYHSSLRIQGEDLANIGKGLRFFAVLGGETFVYALGVMALTYLCKSSIGAIIVFLIYKGIDAALSAFSTTAVNYDLHYNNDWFGPLVPLAKAINPFLLGSSTNRLLMQDYYSFDCGACYGNGANSQIVAGSSVGLAVIVLCGYATVFVGLALFLLRRRDVTE